MTCSGGYIKFICRIRDVFTVRALVLLLKDTFKLYQIVNGQNVVVPFDGKGIGWWTDYNVKFKNPDITPLQNAFNGWDSSLIYHNELYLSLVNILISERLNKELLSLSGTVKPIYWTKAVYELDFSDPSNNGFINQDFLVWMRRAALPNFRKLYRRITEGDYTAGLPAGNYSLEISYSILFKPVYRLMWCFKAQKETGRPLLLAAF